MKRTLMIAALLSLAACTKSPAEQFAAGQIAFAAHDYQAARVHVAAALAERPGDAGMLLLQARTLLALGDGEGAGSALNRITAAPAGVSLAELKGEAALLRRAPKAALTALGDLATPEAERQRALAAVQQDDLKTAGDHFAKGAALGGNGRLFADYARFKLITGDVAGAAEMAARGAKLDPGGLDTLLVGGQLAVRRGDLAKALALYRRAGKSYPTSLAALTGEAAVLGDLGRSDEMKDAIARAAAFAPKDLTVVYLGASAAAARKDWAGVRAAVQPVEADLPPVHPLRAIYGEALTNLGQHQLAIAQLNAAARTGQRTAVRLLAQAQLGAGDAKAASATLRGLADSPAARPDELALMAKIAKATRDPKAADYAKRAAAPAANPLGSDMAAADMAMRAGNWAGAAQAYDRVLAVTDGRSIIVLNNMANAQLNLGNQARAEEFAARALKLAPDNASVLDTAGWVTFKSGRDLAKAQRLLRMAAEKAPDNATIAAHLAEATGAAAKTKR